MKILLFFSCVVVLGSTASAFSADALAIINKLSNLEVSDYGRVKRDASNDSQATQEPRPSQKDVACVAVPLREFQSEVRGNGTFFDNLTDSNVTYEGHNFYSRLNLDSLTALCKIYIPRRAQIDGCENSTVKSYAMDAFAIFDFICLERYDDLKASMPCLQSIDPDVSKACTPTCSDAQDKVEGFSNLDTSLANETDKTKKDRAAAAVATFSRFCKHIKCLVSCQTPIIKSKCGQPPVLLIHDGVRLLFTKLNKLNTATKAEEYWPKVCSDLATGDFNKP